jgi:hypothetical protein
VLPWALLVAGNMASLAANVAVAEPTLIGRVIAAWPLFALTASDELFTHIGFLFPATHEDAETSLVAGALPDLVWSSCWTGMWSRVARACPPNGRQSRARRDCGV